MFVDSFGADLSAHITLQPVQIPGSNRAGQRIQSQFGYFVLSDNQNEPGFVVFILGFVYIVGDGWRTAGG